MREMVLRFHHDITSKQRVVGLVEGQVLELLLLLGAECVELVEPSSLEVQVM